MPSEFSQLGIAGITLGILWWIVKYFVSALNNKDIYLEKNNERTAALIKDFQAHVQLCNDNFIKSSQITSKALDKLTAVIATNTLVLKINTAAGGENTVAIDENTKVIKIGNENDKK